MIEVKWKDVTVPIQYYANILNAYEHHKKWCRLKDRMVSTLEHIQNIEIHLYKAYGAEWDYEPRPTDLIHYRL